MSALRKTPYFFTRAQRVWVRDNIERFSSEGSLDKAGITAEFNSTFSTTRRTRSVADLCYRIRVGLYDFNKPKGRRRTPRRKPAVTKSVVALIADIQRSSVDIACATAQLKETLGA